MQPLHIWAQWGKAAALSNYMKLMEMPVHLIKAVLSEIILLELKAVPENA